MSSDYNKNNNQIYQQKINIPQVTYRNIEKFAVSTNGRCGPNYGNTSCSNNQCCSIFGWCGGQKGQNDDWCATYHGYNGAYDGINSTSSTPAPTPTPTVVPTVISGPPVPPTTTSTDSPSIATSSSYTMNDTIWGLIGMVISCGSSFCLCMIIIIVIVIFTTK